LAGKAKAKAVNSRSKKRNSEEFKENEKSEKKVLPAVILHSRRFY
jgi:hypothetical protein